MCSTLDVDQRTLRACLGSRPAGRRYPARVCLWGMIVELIRKMAGFDKNASSCGWWEYRMLWIDDVLWTKKDTASRVLLRWSASVCVSLCGCVPVSLLGGQSPCIEGNEMGILSWSVSSLGAKMYDKDYVNVALSGRSWVISIKSC